MSSSISIEEEMKEELHSLHVESQKHITEYTTFIEQTLRPQLKFIQHQVKEVEEEISEYQSLKSILLQQQQEGEEEKGRGEEEKGEKEESILKNPIVDLGYQAIYCSARQTSSSNENNKNDNSIRNTNTSKGKDNPKSIFVNVGLGFHIEFTTDEAMQFCNNRIQFLKTNVLPHRKTKLTQIQDHFQSSLNILQELEQLH